MDIFELFNKHWKSIILILIALAFYIFLFLIMLSGHIRDKMAKSWNKHKCNPLLMPFAGFFKKKDDPRGFWQFTFDNFEKCILTFFKTALHLLLKPILDLFKIIGKILSQLAGVINRFRFQLNISRVLFTKIVGDIAAKITNSVAAVKFYQAKMLNLINQQKATLETMVLFAEGFYDTMESIIHGPWVAFIIWVPVSFALIVIEWFLCGFSDAGDEPESSACPYVPCGKVFWYINMAFLFPPAYLYLLYMSLYTGNLQCSVGDVTGLTAEPTCLTPPFEIPLGPLMPWYFLFPMCVVCFHPETPIQLDATTTQPIQSLRIGDRIQEGGRVLSIYRYSTKLRSCSMFNYRGIIVSGSHMVFQDGVPVRIADAKGARRIPYDEDWICCINTETKRLWSGGQRFTDFFESTCPITNWINQRLIEMKLNETWDTDLESIEALAQGKNLDTLWTWGVKRFRALPLLDQTHVYEWGVLPSTRIVMEDGSHKSIGSIVAGDRVKGGGLVVGLVQHCISQAKCVELTHPDTTSPLQVVGTQLVYSNQRKQWRRAFQHEDARPLEMSSLPDTSVYYSILCDQNILYTNTGYLLRDYTEISSEDVLFDVIHAMNLRSVQKEEGSNAPRS